jgi:hypothetical protein
MHLLLLFITGTANIGFYFVKANNRTHTFFSALAAEMRVNEHKTSAAFDQYLFNLCSEKMTRCKPGSSGLCCPLPADFVIDIRLLDPHILPCRDDLRPEYLIRRSALGVHVIHGQTLGSSFAKKMIARELKVHYTI